MSRNAGGIYGYPYTYICIYIYIYCIYIYMHTYLYVLNNDLRMIVAPAGHPRAVPPGQGAQAPGGRLPQQAAAHPGRVLAPGISSRGFGVGSRCLPEVWGVAAGLQVSILGFLEFGSFVKGSMLQSRCLPENKGLLRKKHPSCNSPQLSLFRERDPSHGGLRKPEDHAVRSHFMRFTS